MEHPQPGRTVRTTLRVLLSVVLAIAPALGGSALEPGILFLSIAPGGDIPFPVTISGVSGSYHRMGGGAVVSGDYAFPAAPILFGGGSLSCVFAPANKDVTNSDSLFTLLAFAPRAGLQFEPIPDLTLELAGKAGWSLISNTGRTGNGPYFGVDAGLSYQFVKGFGLCLDASYDDYWSLLYKGPQYHALAIRLGARFAVGRGSDAKLDMRDIRFFPVFPVFKSYYDENPIGEVRIKNAEKGTIRDVKISFFARQYMDGPKSGATIREMRSGEEIVVPLFALFTDRILDITEGTKTMADISAEYLLKDEKRTRSISWSVEIQNRNAMSWDDDRRAAAFVTPKDPAVLKYAKGVASVVRDAGGGDVNQNFRIAMGLFESLALYGVNYVKDPSSPYEQYSTSKAVIDFLQFPSQTLSYKAGDCDDLSILVCAMLEAVGIETAFITVPGHIFMAFSADAPPAEARAAFSSPDDLIFLEGQSWIPLEITMIKDGFLKAWQAGAKEWREAGAQSTAALYPLHAAWALYKPTGIMSGEQSVDMPRIERVAEQYSKALARFVEREVGPRASRLREEIAAGQNDPKLINRLGLLYARYGMYDEAAAEFSRAAADKEYAPALINLGNIYYLKSQWAKALSLFERAYRQNQKNPVVLLSIAKAKYEMEDLAGAREYHSKLAAESPELASKYSYLVSPTGDVQGRAGSNDLAARAAWME